MNKDFNKSKSLNEKLENRGLSFVEKWNEYSSLFFDRISLMNQYDETKSEISQAVVEDSKVGPLYWSQIILSALIATFGLLQNSVAVVIGAMLLAPLFIPLQAIAFAIAEGKSKLFWRSLGVLLLSTLIAVGIAIGIVWIVPLEVETSEILSRVSPNIYDLFIAGFSAVIALLALVYKRLSQSVAGVAMAASLMPPLGVIGIQIGFGNFQKASGALLLYTTNIVAILLVGVLMFILYGFHPHKDKSYSVMTQGVFLLIVTVGLSVPLVASIQAQQSEISLFNNVQSELNESLGSVLPSGEVSQLKVEDEDNVVEISLDLRLPEDVVLFESDLQKFTDLLSENMDREVNFNLDIIRTASLSKQVDEMSSLITEIELYTQNYFEEVDDKLLVELNVAELEGIYEIDLLYVLESEDFTELEKSSFNDGLFARFVDYNFEANWLPLNSVSNNQMKVNSFQESIRAYLENELPTGWFVSRVSVKELNPNIEDSFKVDISLFISSSLRRNISDEIVNTELERVLTLYEFYNFKENSGKEFSFDYEYGFIDSF